MVPVMIILYNCCTMHNSTHSVHKRLLRLWRDRLLHLWPCRYVPSPPLSGASCQPIPPPGRPGPPASKMASFSQDPHTPPPHCLLHYHSKMVCNGIPRVFLFQEMVRNGIPRFFSFAKQAEFQQNSHLFCLVSYSAE
jgi:hypothetical protein